ncbi:MAG: SGNH/GDSL hydrolase family protein [Bacteroidales bacterium]|nr:SGNH/GDSL hydrolase family protein [Bacteroidales bacterium]
MRPYFYFIKTAIIAVFTLITLSLNAQVKWFNPAKSEFPVIQNQGWSGDTISTYNRLPNSAKEKILLGVWYQTLNSAGIAISFYSNSPRINVRYTLKNKRLAMEHMPATGVSGVDLYCINQDGIWDYCVNSYSFKDTVNSVFIQDNKIPCHQMGFEYRLYLPLYNGVEWLEIGVNEDSYFEFLPKRLEKPFVVYGTSIAHGGCASRPGMAWTNILNRRMDHPVINLGFSGNGRLETEVLDYISQIDSRMFILDCYPNMEEMDKQEVENRTINAVKQLREKSSAPILITEHCGFSDEGTNARHKEFVKNVNEAAKSAYDKLKEQSIANVYYLSKEELDLDPDSRVDYAHYTDLGMQQHAYAVEKKAREILHEPIGNLKTTKPVTQRREPYNYEWMKRHQAILALNKTNKPKGVIFGNSITHYWGGLPEGGARNGAKNWKKIMEKAGFQNMGFGWDKVENVIWRIYNDELADINPEKVVLMIGTNNLGGDPDENIVEGINAIISAIQVRLPLAKIKVVGIFPRRNDEQKVIDINKKIEALTKVKGVSYLDIGHYLVDKNGKVNEKLFSDGLHPNEEGYSLIGKDIADFK